MMTRPWVAHEVHGKAEAKRSRTTVCSFIRTSSGATLNMDKSMKIRGPMTASVSTRNAEHGRTERYDGAPYTRENRACIEITSFTLQLTIASNKKTYQDQ
jgi:hypothetical protein